MQCVFPGCDRPAYAHHRCNRHYQRYRRHGEDRPDPLAMPGRFWQYVAKGEGCWEWRGAKVRGYGYFRLDDKQQKAHRIAYALVVGPIPDGLTIDHLCQNKGCCNPVHMEPVTASENLSRLGRRMTRCRKGHEFTPANTRISTTGRRICLACYRAYHAAYNAGRGLIVR